MSRLVGLLTAFGLCAGLAAQDDQDAVAGGRCGARASGGTLVERFTKGDLPPFSGEELDRGWC